jgi:hypothetical protein
MRIAFLYGRCHCRLDVVDLATDKLRQLMGTHGPTYVAWSPDSRQLLVTEGCLLWRMPANGGKPHRLRSCS